MNVSNLQIKRRKLSGGVAKYSLFCYNVLYNKKCNKLKKSVYYGFTKNNKIRVGYFYADIYGKSHLRNSKSCLRFS